MQHLGLPTVPPFAAYLWAESEGAEVKRMYASEYNYACAAQHNVLGSDAYVTIVYMHQKCFCIGHKTGDQIPTHSSRT